MKHHIGGLDNNIYMSLCNFETMLDIIALLFAMLAFFYARWSYSGFQQFIAKQPKRYVVSKPFASGFTPRQEHVD